MIQRVESYFKCKLDEALEIIKKHNLSYYKLGLFGSYARGDYDASSDIDIVMIFEELPPRAITANLRWELDEINVDFAVLLKSTFDNPNSSFSKEVVKDFKEIEI